MGLWSAGQGVERGMLITVRFAGHGFEEAGAIVQIGPLYSLLNVPHAEQVHLFYNPLHNSRLLQCGFGRFPISIDKAGGAEFGTTN